MIEAAIQEWQFILFTLIWVVGFAVAFICVLYIPEGGKQMRYWECKCGNLQAFGSDSPSECVSCHKCGTNAYKKQPWEHEWKLKYDENTGKPKYYRCNKCSERKPIDEPKEGRDE
jgi:hypothetical protein